MTVTMTPNLNGRSQRKSLASQLDRLDSMLDGLDQGLQGAITDAVKEAVSTAVAEAVRTTILQVATNPEIHSFVRSSLTSLIQQAIPKQPPSTAETVPSTSAQPRNVLSRAWQWAKGKVKDWRIGLSMRIRAIREGIASVYRQANSVWSLKRPILIALGVGAVVGIAGYAASPWLAGVVSGVSATVAALGTQLAIWARRVFSRIPSY